MLLTWHTPKVRKFQAGQGGEACQGALAPVLHVVRWLRCTNPQALQSAELAPVGRQLCPVQEQLSQAAHLCQGWGLHFWDFLPLEGIFLPKSKGTDAQLDAAQAGQLLQHCDGQRSIAVISIQELQAAPAGQGQRP
jgi:hypothetical protein